MTSAENAVRLFLAKTDQDNVFVSYLRRRETTLGDKFHNKFLELVKKHHDDVVNHYVSRAEDEETKEFDAADKAADHIFEGMKRFVLAVHQMNGHLEKLERPIPGQMDVIEHNNAAAFPHVHRVVVDAQNKVNSGLKEEMGVLQGAATAAMNADTMAKVSDVEQTLKDEMLTWDKKERVGVLARYRERTENKRVHKDGNDISTRCEEINRTLDELGQGSSKNDALIGKLRADFEALVADLHEMNRAIHYIITMDLLVLLDILKHLNSEAKNEQHWAEEHYMPQLDVQDVESRIAAVKAHIKTYVDSFNQNILVVEKEVKHLES